MSTAAIVLAGWIAIAATVLAGWVLVAILVTIAWARAAAARPRVLTIADEAAAWLRERTP